MRQFSTSIQNHLLIISIQVYLTFSMCAIRLIRKLNEESQTGRMRMFVQVGATLNETKPNKKCLRRNKFVYNWNLVIYPYNLLVVSVCGAISNVIFNLCFVSSSSWFSFVAVLFLHACDLTPHALAPGHIVNRL